MGRGDDQHWWQPLHDGSSRFYWPAEAPRHNTLATYVAAYEAHDFRVCSGDEQHDDHETIVIWTKDGVPRHAAKQLPSGLWSSKLGNFVAIEHTLAMLTGGIYGEPAVSMRRPLVIGGKR